MRGIQWAEKGGMAHVSGELSGLRQEIAAAQLRLFELDLSACQGKAEFLSAMACALQVPDGFGHNFDALADVLADFSWREDAGGRGYALLLLNAGETLGLNASDYAVVADIFKETAAYWQTQGKSFWVLLP